MNDNELYTILAALKVWENLVQIGMFDPKRLVWNYDLKADAITDSVDLGRLRSKVRRYYEQGKIGKDESR